MNIKCYQKFILWMLCLVLWPATQVKAERVAENCTSKIPLCVNLAPHFVDSKNPLEKISIRDRITLSEKYELVLLAYWKFGAFIVDSTTGKHYMTIAMLPTHMWKITRSAHDFITLTQYSDYGYVLKKIKIFFDIPSKKVFPGQEFKEVRVNRANVYKKELIMTATTAGRDHRERSFIVRFSDREGPKGRFGHDLVQEIKQAPLEPIRVTREEKGALQFISNQYRYTYSDAGWERTKLFPTMKEARAIKTAEALGFPKFRFHMPLALVQEHLLIRDGPGDDLNRYLVWNNEINSGHYVTGVKVRQHGTVKFYPLPQPSAKLAKQLKPQYSDRDFDSNYSISNAVGPFQFMDSKIWFGLTFYDGEGESGVGGYGYFDTETLQYNIEYKPKWADMSASAFYINGNSMWLGLYHQGEVNYSGGVIRYDLQTGDITHFEIPEVVHVVKEWQGAVFFGTTNGVWILASGKMTQGYFTIDRKGNYRLEWNAPRALP